MCIGKRKILKSETERHETNLQMKPFAVKLICSCDTYIYVLVKNRSNMPMFCLKKLISQPWVVQESPSLAQMTFTQCASMADLKFDSVAPPGGQIHQYVSFSVLFQSPTKDMTQKYGSTVKNLILGFSPKLSGGVLIYVWKPGKNFGPKSQC